MMLRGNNYADTPLTNELMKRRRKEQRMAKIFRALENWLWFLLGAAAAVIVAYHYPLR